MSNSYISSTEYPNHLKEQCGIVVRTLDFRTNESFFISFAAFEFLARRPTQTFPFPGRRKTNINNNVARPPAEFGQHFIVI